MGAVRFELLILNISLFISPRMHLFDQKYSKKYILWFFLFKTAVFDVNICLNVIYFCDQSCIFSIITPVFSVTWSSEIIIICWFDQENFCYLLLSFIVIFINYYQCWKYLCRFIFFVKVMICFSWTNKNLFEIKILCNIINVFAFAMINYAYL